MRFQSCGLIKNTIPAVAQQREIIGVKKQLFRKLSEDIVGPCKKKNNLLARNSQNAEYLM